MAHRTNVRPRVRASEVPTELVTGIWRRLVFKNADLEPGRSTIVPKRSACSSSCIAHYVGETCLLNGLSAGRIRVGHCSAGPAWRGMQLGEGSIKPNGCRSFPRYFDLRQPAYSSPL
jgi:hypothetical protein